MADEQEGNGFDEVVKIIEKGVDSRVYVRVSEFRGQDYLHIRNYYPASEEEWKPTRKGIALPVQFYEELLKGLKDAGEVIKKRQEEEEADE